MSGNQQAIGVFDSGVGGLTVLKALMQRLPNESFIYLGDTARVPYGTKSPETVRRYAVQAAKALVSRDIKMLVVACNTASSLALDQLQEIFPSIPVIGVIIPGAEAAVAASRNGHIAVIATEATVKQGAYDDAIHQLRPDAITHSRACPIFVTLAEEGWHNGEITEAVAYRYLQPLLTSSNRYQPDCLVLGCTHFPILIDTIRAVVGKKIAIVDSATTTANTVAATLAQKKIINNSAEHGNARFLVTDAPERFGYVATRFLGRTLHADDIEVIDF